jgi:membrane-associated phospholipid phosphatase
MAKVRNLWAGVFVLMVFIFLGISVASFVTPIALIVVAGAAFTLAKSIFHRVRPGVTLSPILVAVVFVGLDRLVLGVHWFSDLLGSGLLNNPYRKTRVR